MRSDDDGAVAIDPPQILPQNPQQSCCTTLIEALNHLSLFPNKQTRRTTTSVITLTMPGPSTTPRIISHVYNNRYQVVEKLDEGSFGGKLFLVYDQIEGIT